MDYNALELVGVAEQLVKLSGRVVEKPDPTDIGGYLTIATTNIANPGLHQFEMRSFRVGPIDGKPFDPARFVSYLKYSREKIFRTAADSLRDPLILSSWSTRQEEIGRYGGAVRFSIDLEESRYISFSGMAEHIDESISLVLGGRLGWSNQGHENKVIAVSNNIVFPRLSKEYRRLCA